MANCHKCLLRTPSIEGNPCSGSKKYCFANCKSSFGRAIVYTIILASIIIAVSGAFFSMVFASRYLSSLLFVSNAVRNVCGSNAANSPLCQSKLMASTASSGDYSVSYVTIDSEDNAKKLAMKLVESKLAACVNIIPKVISIYEWKGEVQTDNELILMIKTRTSTLPTLTDFIKSNHPYEVCEVISMPIQHGNQAYLDWIGNQVPEKVS